MANGSNWDDYPLTLRPKHLRQITGLSEKKLYDFLKDPPFHINRIGKEIFISRNVFREWYENGTGS